jgi:dihydrofolate reductase
MRIVVVNHLTLDGVMQAPGRPDEDTRGGFTAGGWATQARDQQPLIEAIGERMGTPGGGMLLGRRSYEGMLTQWNKVGGPFADGLNATPKYVASRNPDTELEWPNSTLLSGDLPSVVADLKKEPGGNLVMMGSGELIRALLPDDLIDEFLLMVHPLILGSGTRLFGNGAGPAPLSLVETQTTSDGVVLLTYRSPPS